MKSSTALEGNSYNDGRPTADKVRFYYVYVLKCNNNAPYVGCTEDLRGRVQRHLKGYVPATKMLLPVELVSYFAFKNKYTAFNFEKYLKSGSGRVFLRRRLFRE